MRQPIAAVLSGTAVTAALAAGSRFGPQSPRTALWYGRLRKPSFTPPGPAIGVAWTALGVLLAYGGNRLLAAPRSPERSLALASWGMTVLGIVGYPWAFFGRRELGASTAVAAGMLATTATTVAAASRVDRPAALATAPLLAWVGFAVLLSEEVWRRNAK